MPIQTRTIVKSNETQPTDVSFIGESNGVVSQINTLKNIETFSESGQEYFSQVALNYDSLKPANKDGILAFVELSQGTAWLPFTLGGTYYPSGLYVWDEPTKTWASSRTKVAEGIDAASGTSGSSSFSGDYNDLTNKPSIPTQITDSEITALGYVKTDNDTQLTDFDITALGYIKTDTNTQLSDGDIAAFGYIKTDTNTQLSDADITALGYVKTDNNTQLSDGDIAAFGYVKTDNDTQLSQSDIEAMGFSTTDNVLTDSDITALGYIKTDTNTQLSQSEIEAMGFSTTDNDTQLTDAEITALGYIKTDTNTQLTQTEIEAMGFSTIDNDTQLSDGDIAAFGYIKTDTNTQLSQSDIEGMGFSTIDNDTQLSDADITALGYIKTDTNTQLSDADITALGYIKTDTNTQLNQSDIEAMGFSTTDNDTQLSDADITALGYVKTSGTDITFFQVQDDGTTGQAVTNGYQNVQGIWDTPSLTNSDFTFDNTLGHLTVNTAGTIEFDCKLATYNILNNRHELYIELQKNGVTLTSDAQYASRNNNQQVGGAYIMGYKDTCSIGDIYKLRTKRVGVEATIGVNKASGMSYMSAKLYK